MLIRKGLQVTFTVMLMCGATLLVAQSERGTISGTVHDTSGAVIPQAKVIITNPATNVVVNLTTNGVGEYTAASVPVGTYNIQVQKEDSVRRRLSAWL